MRDTNALWLKSGTRDENDGKESSGSSSGCDVGVEGFRIVVVVVGAEGWWNGVGALNLPVESPTTVQFVLVL